MSRLYCRLLAAPMLAIILAELGCKGSEEMSSFHGLSRGKTCSAARILSASGVLNRTGLVTSGIFGRSAPAATSTVSIRRGKNHFIALSSPGRLPG